MPVWQIQRLDPGYLYLIEDNGRYKLGKTKTEKDRLKAAKTWLPDMKLIARKPLWGISHHERCLHTALVRHWYSGEWFKFDDDNEMEQYFLDGFGAFADDNPDRNSVDFIYWYNEGMVEFVTEMDRQNLTLSKFKMQESSVQKTT
ncbi:GIY-YIG nuclease family protein [Jiella marina]|uniref:GIY-YIG nuclease family protein n=1 Tax=Jiella sp. LLJ827 TaxID=2917712 RepID=UPI002101C57B|nr:GIY-YIG nuclease family protein [Jiella sp. LLJ827]MCQ0987350.1 hypothetical protein [Jiella sp. LLJ827]